MSFLRQLAILQFSAFAFVGGIDFSFAQTDSEPLVSGRMNDVEFARASLTDDVFYHRIERIEQRLTQGHDPNSVSDKGHPVHTKRTRRFFLVSSYATERNSVALVAATPLAWPR